MLLNLNGTSNDDYFLTIGKIKDSKTDVPKEWSVIILAALGMKAVLGNHGWCLAFGSDLKTLTIEVSDFQVSDNQFNTYRVPDLEGNSIRMTGLTQSLNFEEQVD